MKVEYELAKAYELVNKKRNWLLTGTVASAVIMLFCISSIAQGKVKADELKSIRTAGTLANAYLENATQEQYLDIQKLKYVNQIGREKIFGTWYQNNNSFYNCIVLDTEGYENIYKLAYTDIIGSYPKETNEVMLSTKMLDDLGITDPVIGMKILINITREDWMISGTNNGEENFTLSGYYTDYKEIDKNIPSAYFSKHYLETNKIDEYPTRVLLRTKKTWISGIQLEERLYQDIITEDNQQFIGLDSGIWQAMESFIGGYGIAFVCIIIILISVYLLIYNVISISMNRDINQYGLLKVLGATTVQIRKMYFYQIQKIIITGCSIGVLCGFVVVLFGLPILLKKLYLAGVGSTENMKILYPEFLIFAILFTCLATMIAASKSTRKMMRLSPIETLHYEDISSIKGQEKIHSKKGASLPKMAWRNVIRSKRKFWSTLLSMALGCQVALAAVVIGQGTDITHQITQNPDFEIGIGKEAMKNYLFNQDGQLDYNEDGKTLFSDEFINQISEIAEISRDRISLVWGNYGSFWFSDNTLQPRLDATPIKFKNTGLTIQVVTADYLDELETYVKRNHLKTDLTSLKNGTGFVLLHRHELSESLAQKADEVIGEPLHILAVEEGLGNADEDTLICCGYLDTTKNGFPKLDMTWNGDGINYIIITQKAYEKLNLQKQNFKISFDVKADEEPEIMKKLTQIVLEANSKSGKMNTFYLSANSNTLSKVKSYIMASRMIMVVLSITLILMGLMNYMNTMTTGIISRRREFAIMESVGMTRRQLQKMLAWEGIYYVISIAFFLISVGSIILWIINIAIKHTLPYFEFSYPGMAFCLIIFLLSIFSVCIPQVAYYKVVKENVTERLRREL